MPKFTLTVVLGVIAILAFVYAGLLVDHSDSLPGNSWVFTDAGLAFLAASFIPFRR